MLSVVAISPCGGRRCCRQEAVRRDAQRHVAVFAVADAAFNITEQPFNKPVSERIIERLRQQTDFNEVIGIAAFLEGGFDGFADFLRLLVIVHQDLGVLVVLFVSVCNSLRYRADTEHRVEQGVNAAVKLQTDTFQNTGKTAFLDGHIKSTT